jgi:hypothetical protein
MPRLAAPLFALALLGLPASAGEVGLFADKLQGKSQVDAAGNRYDAVSPSGFGIRAAYTLINLKVAEIGITASYHPESEADLILKSPLNVTTRGRMGVSYGAIGAQVDWKFLVSIHAGLEMRHERLAWSGLASGNGSSTLDRPWARVGFGFSLPVPVLSPIIRLEFSAPLRKQDGNLLSSGDTREALAPQAQGAIYVGVRF